MKRLTKGQINQIQQIIKNHMAVLTKILIGEGNPSPELVKKLGLPKSITDMITDSYQYGVLQILSKKKIENLTQKEVQNLIDSLSSTKQQQQAIDYLKIKTQLSIDSLQNKMIAGVTNLAIQEQLNMYQAVGQVIPKNMKTYTPQYKVIQQLREYSNDWNRDWHRVAHTEMWSAKNHGIANTIINDKAQKGTDTLVYIRVAKNACPHCKRLYLDSDGIPKIFKLSELLANGTNYGKKVANWLPVIPPCHPNCMCILMVLPQGYKFNALGELEHI